MNAHRAHRARCSGGFTLLEVLIAIMILAGGVLVLAASWSGNTMRLQKARLNNTLSFLLQRQMVEVEAKYKDRLNDMPESDEGDFEGYQGYSWTLTAKEFEMPDLSGALIAREGGADELMLTMVRTIGEYIKQAVKEVTVTVAFEPDGAAKPISASATTYYIDYSKEPSLGGVPTK